MPTGGNVVVKVTPGGTLSIFAGNYTIGPTSNGPATSTALYGPQGLALDAAGNLYIADNRQIEQVTPSGTLTVIAGDGTFGAPTYGGLATSSALNQPTGVAVVPGGTVYIAERGNNTIDRVGLATPAAPGQPVLTPGDGRAQMSFTPPIDPGTSAISAYQVSLDGGATWTTITTSPGPNGTLTATLTGLTDGTTYSVVVRAVNDGGPGPGSPSGSVTPQSQAPQNTGLPQLSGRPGVGQTLTCSQGSWTNHPTAFSYKWERDGVPIRGASNPSYRVQLADQGHTVVCVVTAHTSAASGSASSVGLLIPINEVSLCPKSTGRLAGTRLGSVSLGLSRAHVRRMLPRFSVRSGHTDNFCLAGGWGIRVGYATRALLRKLPGDPHAKGIILALTANPYYTLQGIRHGMPVRAAAARVHLGEPIHWGGNAWYVIPGPKANWVLKARHGIVQEIGIANKQLTTTRRDQTWLLASF